MKIKKGIKNKVLAFVILILFIGTGVLPTIAGDNNKEQNITKLIEDIREEIKGDNLGNLRTKIEDLKTAMKDMVAANQSSSDPMSNLNDL